jgi:hypothetical protein
MISLIVSLIVFCVVAGVLCMVARALLAAFGVAQPWANVAYALLCLLLLFLFLSEVGWVSEPHAWRSFR